MMSRSITQLAIAYLFAIMSTGMYAADCGRVTPLEVDTETPTNVQLADSLKLKNPFIFIRREGQQKAIVVAPANAVFKIGPFSPGRYRLYVNGWGDVELNVRHRGVNLPNYFLDVIPASLLDKSLPPSKLCPTFSAVSN
jgi:hypothetical protein